MIEEHTPEQKRRESFLTIFLTLFGAAGFLLFMIAVSGGFFFYVVLAVVAIALFAWLHYVLWGRALMENTAGQREEEEQRARLDAEDFSSPEVREVRRRD